MNTNGQIVLVQGNSWRGPDIGIGLTNVVSSGAGQAQAQLMFFDDLGPEHWESDVELARGAIVPVAGRFLEVAAIDTADGAQRDTVLLQPVADAGGIAAPDRRHALLIEGGKGKFGDSWLSLTAIDGSAGVTIERWPLGRARSRLAPDEVLTSTLSPGQEIVSGTSRYRLVRIQPPAGSLLGFVEFAAE